MPIRTLSRRDVLIGGGATAAVLATFDVAARTPPAAVSAPVAALASTRSALDRYVPTYLAAMNAPGMTLALATREGDALAAAYGWSSVEAREPLRTDHLFQVGSITKSFVALVLLQMRDEGRVDLARPVLDYLPWLPIEQPFGPVTIHHLLTHSSGFPSESPLFPAGGARLAPHYAPGVRFHYSNWAYDVLGTLIERLDGQPWPRVVERRIFVPLGMTASAGAITPAIAPRAARSYVVRDDTAFPRHGAMTMAGPLTVTRGAGSIASTPGDMARYMRMLLNRGAAPRGRIVSERAFEAFATPHVSAPDWGEDVHYGYGIGLELRDGERILRHTGGMVSFMSSLQVNLDAGVGAFASINAQQGYRPNRVTRYALASMRAARAGAAPPPEPVADERDAPAPDDYVGTYTTAAGRSVDVVADGGGLVLVDRGRRIRLDHAGTDQFVAPDPEFATYTLVFERGAPGEVEILGYGDRAYFHARHAGPREDATPPALRALEGTFRSDDPWTGTTRIVARRGRLWAQTSWDGPVPLMPDGEHTFRVGELESPDVARFDGFADGVPQVLWVGGVPVPRASV